MITGTINVIFRSQIKNVRFADLSELFFSVFRLEKYFTKPVSKSARVLHAFGFTLDSQTSHELIFALHSSEQ